MELNKFYKVMVKKHTEEELIDNEDYMAADEGLDDEEGTLES